MQHLPARPFRLPWRALENKWGGKYGYVIKSWRDNWTELTVFLDFSIEISQIIYITNLIENLNSKIGKVY